MYGVIVLVLMKMSKYSIYFVSTFFFFSVIHAPLPSPVDKVTQ